MWSKLTMATILVTSHLIPITIAQNGGYNTSCQRMDLFHLVLYSSTSPQDTGGCNDGGDRNNYTNWRFASIDLRHCLQYDNETKKVGWWEDNGDGSLS